MLSWVVIHGTDIDSVCCVQKEEGKQEMRGEKERRVEGGKGKKGK